MQLKVHTRLAGDISDKLGRYTFEANLQHTLDFLEKWGGTELSPLEVEVLERGVTSFPCERPSAPYQEERKLMVSPLVGWAALALLHRLWPVGAVVGLGVAALVVWRVQTRGRRGQDRVMWQNRILYLLIVTSLISLLTGCASQRTNSQFTVRVSGNTNGLPFDGQCTAQKAGFWPGESVAQGLDVKGTVYSVSQPQDYETSGYFIYCAVANQSATGTITVELLQGGNVVASAQSTSPDKPATLEFGQKP